MHYPIDQKILSPVDFNVPQTRDRLYIVAKQNNLDDFEWPKKIKQKRQELGLSQEKLGELSKLHRTYISLLERGLKSPTILTANKIAKALNMNISELLEGL